MNKNKLIAFYNDNVNEIIRDTFRHLNNTMSNFGNQSTKMVIDEISNDFLPSFQNKLLSTCYNKSDDIYNIMGYIEKHIENLIQKKDYNQLSKERLSGYIAFYFEDKTMSSWITRIFEAYEDELLRYNHRYFNNTEVFDLVQTIKKNMYNAHDELIYNHKNELKNLAENYTQEIIENLPKEKNELPIPVEIINEYFNIMGITMNYQNNELIAVKDGKEINQVRIQDNKIVVRDEKNNYNYVLLINNNHVELCINTKVFLFIEEDGITLATKTNNKVYPKIPYENFKNLSEEEQKLIENASSAFVNLQEYCQNKIVSKESIEPVL